MATTNINGFNITGNNTSPDQFGHLMRKLFSGNVSGLAVSQNATPNMTVSVGEGVALLTKNTTSSVWAEVKGATSVTIATADTANPRIDTVIIYEDTAVALPSTTPYLTDGGGGRFKLGTYSGTAAASPTALSDATIQTTIGAGKPWTRLADVTVAANTTTILNSSISDKRELASAVADGAVTATKIASGAILLGYTQVTSNKSATAGASTEVASVTVTAPGNRKLKITIGGRNMVNNTGGQYCASKIIDTTTGSVGMGGTFWPNMPAGQGCSPNATAYTSTSPAAGTRTYKFEISSPGSGTVTLEAGATDPAYIAVEAV